MSCPICLDSIYQGEIAAANCGHCFHKECIERSRMTLPSCPSCRKPLTSLKKIYMDGPFEGQKYSRKEVDDLIEDILRRTKQVADSKKSLRSADEVAKYEEKIKELKLDLESANRKGNSSNQLKKHFRVTGVPNLAPGTDAMPIIANMASLVNIVILRSDLKDIYSKINKRGTETTIYGKFFEEKKNLEFFSAYKNYTKTKAMKWGDVSTRRSERDAAIGAREIRLRPQLTPYTLELLEKARKYKLGIVWEEDGNVFMQKGKGAPIRIIESFSELQKVAEELTNRT